MTHSINSLLLTHHSKIILLTKIDSNQNEKTALTLFILSFFLFSCNKKQDSDDLSTKSGDEAFLKLAENYIAKSLEWNPQMGVYLGLHNYDGKIGHYNKTSFEKRIAELQKFDQQFSAIDSTTLSKKKY